MLPTQKRFGTNAGPRCKIYPRLKNEPQLIPCVKRHAKIV
jgi:hypothetical protein